MNIFLIFFNLYIQFMIIRYDKYLLEKLDKNESINELLNNFEHTCYIDLHDYNEYCTFNVFVDYLDDDILNDNHLKATSYDYLEEYVSKYLKEECKIPLVLFTNRIDRKTYLYLCCKLYHNFSIGNTSLSDLYIDNMLSISHLNLERYDYLTNILRDIKTTTHIYHLDNLEEYCKLYMNNKNCFNNIYFYELLKIVNNKELIDNYNTFKNAKNFDLL